ncbi:hypothetical protein [Desulfovibrio sp. UCD-KL4C]|uniref:hypothetical protein n=1 Tax=Desulfovibrio sp. UCD-KL4C TaxID=2578120 RepID=UPI0025C4E47D|nr:hypothetical protein [Desulfovibrio sp. UCD-KL4C]
MSSFLVYSLELRESVTCYYTKHRITPDKISIIKKAYAEMDCQYAEYSSQAMKKLVKTCKSLAILELDRFTRFTIQLYKDHIST